MSIHIRAKTKKKCPNCGYKLSIVGLDKDKWRFSTICENCGQDVIFTFKDDLEVKTEVKCV